MTTLQDIQPEIFEFHNKFAQGGAGNVNRNSNEFAKWVQQSLNKILRIRLTEDGFFNPQTRSAIRQFQVRQSLTVDGIVGPQTERALITAGASPPPKTTAKPDAILDRYDFDQTILKPFHNQILQQVASRIAQSFVVGQPRVTVFLVGHTDPVGSASYNLDLGQRRGLVVRRKLAGLLESAKKGLSFKVLILVKSKGESEPLDFSQSDEAKTRNRRVEIFLSTKILLPIKPKKPNTVIELDPIEIVGTPPSPLPSSTCNIDEQNRRTDECIKQIKQCLIDATAEYVISLAACKGNVGCAAAESAKFLVKLNSCNNAKTSCFAAANKDTNCQP